MRGGRDAILLQGSLCVREKVARDGDQLSAIIQRLSCERVKLTSDSINVSEWKLTRVGAIREQNKNPLTCGVDPTARAGETCMTERIGRKTSARGRIFRGGESPRKRMRLVQAFRKVLPKQFAGLRAQQLR